MRFTWPLTGRSEEMRRITDALADPDRNGILVCGAAGVGKSRVVREALDALAAGGAEVRWVMGTSSSRAVPLGAFAPWVRSEPAEGSQLLDLVRGVIDSLTAADPYTPVVVGVDDVHTLDDLSAFVVHQIVTRGAAKVVLTLRDGEPVSNSVRDIWHDGSLDRLDLQPLSQDETTALVESALGGTIHPPDARRLWELTRGNVLYLRNIVDREVADSRLAQSGEVWRWTGDPVMPPDLMELIETRIGTLDPAVSEVVDLLAVCEPVPVRALIRITDPRAVEEADRRNLITLAAVGRQVEVRLAHPLYGELRRLRAPPTRLRRLRGLAAAELAKTQDRDDVRVIVRRAALVVDSDLPPDPDLLVRAAQGALWLADLPLGERLAKAADAAGAGPEAKLVRAHALTWLGRGEEAEEVLAACQREQLTDTEWGRWVFMRVQNTLFTLADAEGAKRLIDEAAGTAPLPNRACIDAIRTVHWALIGRPMDATEAYRRLDLDELPAVVAASTAMAYAVAAGDSGRTTEAVAAADAGYASAHRTSDAAQVRLLVADGHIGAVLPAGRIAEAAAVADAMVEVADDLPSVALTANALAGMAALAAGRLVDAVGLLEPTVSALTGTANGWGYRYRLPYTIALAMRGAVEEATRSLAELERDRHPSWRYVDFEYALARAWVAAAQGAVSEAIDVLLEAAETAGGRGQFAAEVMCLQAATQFGHRGAGPRLEELAAVVEGPRATLAARFAVALGQYDATELVEVSKAFEDVGDVVAAAEAAAHAAVLHRRDNLRGSALASSERAQALADRSGLITPVLRRAVEPSPFTEREEEIIALLALGLGTKEVADRLDVSVRTVEGHIYRAMAKTGAASRDELIELLGLRRRPPDSD